MKVAIVHEFLNQYGGAEKVLESLHELYPNAPVYTLIYEPHTMPAMYKSWDIRQSPFLNNKFVRRYYKYFFVFYSAIMEQFDLTGFDLIISSSYAYTHGVITAPKTCHICYCHTPTRFLWSQSEIYRNSIYKKLLFIYDFMIHILRLWDSVTSSRVDYYVAASKNIAKRIEKYYKKDFNVIHPPVDTSQSLDLVNNSDYYLLVSRLVLPYKSIDIAIHAFNQLGYNLKIVGDGPDKESLQKISNPNIQFLGYLSGNDLSTLYANCKALIFPGEDDFGIVPLEANSYGRPVIAYRAGGILETQIENITAVYFDDPTPDSLVNAVRRFEAQSFNSQTIHDSAKRFDKELFKENLSAFIKESLLTYASLHKFKVIH